MQRLRDAIFRCQAADDRLVQCRARLYLPSDELKFQTNIYHVIITEQKDERMSKAEAAKILADQISREWHIPLGRVRLHNDDTGLFDEYDDDVAKRNTALYGKPKSVSQMVVEMSAMCWDADPDERIPDICTSQTKRGSFSRLANILSIARWPFRRRPPAIGP